MSIMESQHIYWLPHDLPKELSVSFPHVFSFGKTWLIQTRKRPFLHLSDPYHFHFWNFQISIWTHWKSLFLLSLSNCLFFSSEQYMSRIILGLSVGESSWNAWLEMIVNFFLTFIFVILQILMRNFRVWWVRIYREL